MSGVPRFRLARLLRRAEVTALLDTAAGVGPITLMGPDGALLWPPGAPSLRSDPVAPVLGPDGREVGSVSGSGAAAAAAALSALVVLELERRQLADEVLGLYREINALYTLAETLTEAADRPALARRALAETTRLVPADAAVVVVLDGGAAVEAATAGRPCPLPADLDRLRISAEGTGAVLVAPLNTGAVTQGAIVLRRDDRGFTAGELKLVGAVAAQATGVFVRILDEQRRAREAANREEILRRQVDRLRIELDDQRQSEQVRRITNTDYFADLRAQAATLREIVDSPPPIRAESPPDLPPGPTTDRKDRLTDAES